MTHWDAATWFAGVLASGVLGGVVVWVIRSWRRHRRLWDAITGTPAEHGMPGSIGLLIRVGRVEHVVKDMFKLLQVVEERTRELKPNGGASLADKVSRLLEEK